LKRFVQLRTACLRPGLALALAGLVLCLPARAQTASAPGALDQKEAFQISQAALGRIPADYGFTDRHGRSVRLSQFRGKPVLVSFVYTGCFQVCPVTTKFLAQAVAKAQSALGQDLFQVLTIGFNQPFDSPEAMRDFALKQGVALPGWEFLSPEPRAVEALTREFGFVFQPAAGGFDHLTQLTLLDADGRIATQIYGETFEVQMLVEPLKKLLAGEGVPVRDLSGWIEQVRILCTVYDPASGRYRLNYALFIEIFAGLTVIGSVVYYLVSERRRRRRVTPA
jgi:protein SCO1/2